jgi:hypothetical protein
LQVQAAKAVLCAGELEVAGHAKQVDEPFVCEYFPLSHTLQTASPLTFLYLPATHWEHVIPLGPDQPELQVHSAKAVLCAGELEPAGQLLQSVDPAALLYLPV